jgi:hypothetical protein
MQLSLKSISSPDCEIGTYIASDSDVFSVLVQAKIGFADGSQKGDIFTFTACSPGWIGTKVVEMGPMWGHNLLVIKKFSADEIRASIEKILSGIMIEQWEDAVAYISNYASWEFSNYKKYS